MHCNQAVQEVRFYVKEIHAPVGTWPSRVDRALPREFERKFLRCWAKLVLICGRAYENHIFC